MVYEDTKLNPARPINPMLQLSTHQVAILSNDRKKNRLECLGKKYGNVL